MDEFAILGGFSRSVEKGGSLHASEIPKKSITILYSMLLNRFEFQADWSHLAPFDSLGWFCTCLVLWATSDKTGFEVQAGSVAQWLTDELV
jgi:hypothetical protein